MEKLEYSTPKQAKPRPKRSVPVSLCGHDVTFHEPKDTVKFFASQMIADEVSEADRAMALLQFLNGTLDPGDQKRLMDRIADRADPLGRAAVMELVATLLDRWSDAPSTKGTVTIDGPDDGPVFYGDEPIHIVNDELRLDFAAHPPKDLALLLVASGISTGSGVGQQAWSVGFFLDSCTDAQDRLVLNHRLRARDDVLDLTHLTDLVSQLLGRWAPDYVPDAPNRAARRAKQKA